MIDRSLTKQNQEGNTFRPYHIWMNEISTIFTVLNITEIGLATNHWLTLVREGEVYSFNGALFVWSSKGGVRNKPLPDETAVYKRPDRAKSSNARIRRRMPRRINWQRHSGNCWASHNWCNVWVRMARKPLLLTSWQEKKGWVVFFPLSPSIAKGFETGFQFASLSPARFELRVVGRPLQFASSCPAKKVKGSRQQVGGRCRTALIHAIP